MELTAPCTDKMKTHRQVNSGDGKPAQSWSDDHAGGAQDPQVEGPVDICLAVQYLTPSLLAPALRLCSAGGNEASTDAGACLSPMGVGTRHFISLSTGSPGSDSEKIQRSNSPQPRWQRLDLTLSNV